MTQGRANDEPTFAEHEQHRPGQCLDASRQVLPPKPLSLSPSPSIHRTLKSVAPASVFPYRFHSRGRQLFHGPRRLPCPRTHQRNQQQIANSFASSVSSLNQADTRRFVNSACRSNAGIFAVSPFGQWMGPLRSPQLKRHKAPPIARKELTAIHGLPLLEHATFLPPERQNLMTRIPEGVCALSTPQESMDE
jgi:hypothetical protein